MAVYSTSTRTVTHPLQRLRGGYPGGYRYERGINESAYHYKANEPDNRTCSALFKSKVPEATARLAFHWPAAVVGAPAEREQDFGPPPGGRLAVAGQELMALLAAG